MIVSAANTLSRHRSAQGWSQALLAEKCSVSRTEISAIETGRLVPSVAVALRLASALGQSVEAIFGADSGVPSVSWAWTGPAGDGRCWYAQVNRKLLAYPVEPTAAGSIPHDRTAPGGSDSQQSERTLVIAGCDPTVGLLAHGLAQHHNIRLLPLLRSSGEALDLLRRGLVHVAGLHLTDESGRSVNDSSVRAKMGGGYRLVHQLRWDSGIAVSRGRKERTVSALLRARVRWINREEGSAARRALDFLLASRPRPSGYKHVVHDHRSVAAIVSSGWAEAGICVKPAAAEAGVRFIPLHKEAYELCVADDNFGDPRIEALVATLQSAAFRQLIADVPGYVSRDSGAVRRVA